MDEFDCVCENGIIIGEYENSFLVKIGDKIRLVKEEDIISRQSGLLVDQTALIKLEKLSPVNKLKTALKDSLGIEILEYSDLVSYTIKSDMEEESIHIELDFE